MKWSWQIGRVAGIDVRVHATFFLLLAWIAWAHYSLEHSIRAALGGVFFVVLLFAVIVLHELGHALTARRFGIRTRDITLLPIGGVARLERMPSDPRQELLVAVAGPAVNVVLAAVLFGILWTTGTPWDTFHLVESGSVLVRLAWINVALALFNLIPAFPMDGGRALRALLAMRMDPTRATRTAASLGQALALVFGFVGLLGNPVLVFIALFVWLGAEAEAKSAEIRHAAEGIPVSWAMIREAITLSPHQPLGHAAELSISGFQHDFPVVEAGGVVGVLTRSDLLRAIGERGPTAPVGDAMRLDFEVVHPDELLEQALDHLGSGATTCLPVVDDRGTLVGLLNLDALAELMALRTAADRIRPRHHQRPQTA